MTAELSHKTLGPKARRRAGVPGAPAQARMQFACRVQRWTVETAGVQWTGPTSGASRVHAVGGDTADAGEEGGEALVGGGAACCSSPSDAPRHVG